MITIKIKAWLDSGGNDESKYEEEFKVDAQKWAAMTEEEKDEYAKEYAWRFMDWGWREIK